MTYNELLIRIYEVIEDINKEYGKEPSILFKELFNLLNLEKICSEYNDRLNDLTNEEVRAFSSYGKLDNEARRMFIKCYEDAYNSNKVNNTKFLKEYNGIYNYIAATLLNELGHGIYMRDFAEMFNKKINNVYLANEIEKISVACPSVNRLYNQTDIGINFRKALKELELASVIYKKNNAAGLSIALVEDTIIRAVGINGEIDNLDKKFMDLSDEEKLTSANEYLRKVSKVTMDEGTSIYDVFSSMGSKTNWFDNKYYELMINLTSSNSVLKELIDEYDTSYAVGAFMYYLQEKDFLEKVTYEDHGVLRFKDLSGLIRLFKKEKLNAQNKNDFEYEMEKKRSYAATKQIILNIMDGKIDVDKLNKDTIIK